MNDEINHFHLNEGVHPFLEGTFVEAMQKYAHYSAVNLAMSCLSIAAAYHEVTTNTDELLHELALNEQNFEIKDILWAAKTLNLHAGIESVDPQRFEHTPTPTIAICKNPQGREEFVVFMGANDQHAFIHFPHTSNPQLVVLSEFLQSWTGEMVLLTSQASIVEKIKRFDFTWFIPAIVKYRKLLLEVLLVSFVLQFIALITPLFFQVVMDKVLVHRGFTTLDVIAVGLTVVVIFEIAITVLRSYLFSHTTSRIDVELGSRLFMHLLALPLKYFHERRVGDSVARVRELENIRSFLTGNAITVVLDLVFSIVFIAVMLYYSFWLTLIILISLPCYVLLSVVFTPILRVQLDEKFNRGAENQAFLVETISGIDTVKSMAVEGHWKNKWDKQLAAYITASFKTNTTGTLANNGVALISKLVTVATMYMGAHLVIDGHLSLGQLIAFNMLASQVSQPVIRLAQLWTDFQQVGISMQRLGDILNTEPETLNANAMVPNIAGNIRFDHVKFRYQKDSPEVLKGIDLEIKQGEVIGIVGRSGSGKSTLTKLLQKWYVPGSGRILVDGLDIASAKASSLRRQIGVVLQENVLFNTSIRNNIALANPAVKFEEIMKAAKLAGADEFILELTHGYDTLVGEHGSSLSGGQRQRIAIARALLTNPRILIFDEATSALDYESERIIQENMKTICAGRTVIIIAHRLLAVREANRIIVMDHGEIVESGSHHELLKIENGFYKKLYSLQLS